MATKTTHEVSRDLAAKVTEEIAEAARAILQKHGMEMAPTRSKYGAEYALTLKASPIRAGKNGVNLASMEAQEWIATAYLYEITTERAYDALGEVIYTSPATGGDCILIGYNGRKRKMPVIAQSIATKKTYYLSDTCLTKVGVSLKAIRALAWA